MTARLRELDAIELHDVAGGTLLGGIALTPLHPLRPPPFPYRSSRSRIRGRSRYSAAEPVEESPMHELNSDDIAGVAGGTMLVVHPPVLRPLPTQWLKPTPEPWNPVKPQPVPWSG